MQVVKLPIWKLIICFMMVSWYYYVYYMDACRSCLKKWKKCSENDINVNTKKKLVLIKKGDLIRNGIVHRFNLCGEKLIEVDKAKYLKHLITGDGKDTKDMIRHCRKSEIVQKLLWLSYLSYIVCNFIVLIYGSLGPMTHIIRSSVSCVSQEMHKASLVGISINYEECII